METTPFDRHTEAEVVAYLRAPRPLAASDEEAAAWPRCPTCAWPILESDYNFCTSCRTDLRPLQHRCDSCGYGYHVSMRDGEPAGGCCRCGELMPPWPSPSSSEPVPA